MEDRAYSATVQSLLRREVVGLPAYDPGADPEAVLREFGLTRIVKLSNNENPYGISAQSAQIIRRRLDQGLGRYPDPAGRELGQILARLHDVDRNRLILGNGSENIIELLCQAFLSSGERVVTLAPCFGLHEIFPMMMGAHVTKVPLTDQFGLDRAGWTQAMAAGAKLVFISNPSNPVGTAFTGPDLEATLLAMPTDCLLVLDEAYFEYAVQDASYPDGLRLLRDRDRPWIVLRTFSKAYGLASLRVGYGVASHGNLIEALHRVRTPYNVNQLAQEAAVAALSDSAHLQKSVALVTRERERLSAGLRRKGFRVAPSLANFLFIDTGVDASLVVRGLLKHGIIVKAWQDAGYETFIRMSLSFPEENDLFFKVFLLVVEEIIHDVHQYAPLTRVV